MNRPHSLFCRALALTCFVLLLLPSLSLDAAERTKPNILIIVADDLGYSDLGCYGGEIETPNLDALAKNGVRFTRFYNTGRCCPSRASILTGHYPHRVGLGHMTKDIGQPGYRGQVDKNAPTIAEVMKTAGYRSFMSGKWHLGTPDPTKHGFEEFYGTLVSAKTFWDPDHMTRKPDNRARRKYAAGKFYATDAVTDHALDFLIQARETPAKPWFLYLAYNAPHFPLQAPKSDIAKYAGKYADGWDVARERRLKRMKKLGIVAKDTKLTPRSRYADWGENDSGVNPSWKSIPKDRRLDLQRRMAIYAAMVDRLDANVGRVVSDLKKANELDNTMIVFLSDNGACAEWDPYGFDIKSSPNNILHKGDAIDRMGERGTFHSAGSGWANASNTPWRLYKHYTHEGGINTPCIIHWPKNPSGKQDANTAKLLAGGITDAPSHIIDLLPTCAEVAGAKYAGSIPLPGASLFPLHRNAVLNRTLYFEHEGHRAVHEGEWKLVAQKGGPWELYNVSKDRTELDNLADSKKKLVSALSKKWNVWAKQNFVTPHPKDYGVEYLKSDL
jgi:arylsulfatase A-like enzyme